MKEPKSPTTKVASQHPIVSIIVVNWNGVRWLKTLFDSVGAQTYGQLETIMVDNGSSDGSVLYVRENYPWVRIVESERNLGFAGGNNLGIDAAKGEWIMLLNSDTWIDKDLVAGLLDFAERTGLDVVAPKEADYNTKETRQDYVTTIDPMGHPIYLYGDKYGDDRNLYLSGVCVLLKKQLYRASGGMDDNFFMYFEEIDWFWRMRLDGKLFGYAPDLHVYHAGAGSSEGGSLKYNSFLWRNQNCLQMLLKNYRAANLLWVLPLYFLQNCFEIAAFSLLGKRKIAKSYIEGWKFNWVRRKDIWARRKTVQRSRSCDDASILARMYKGPAKLHHLKVSLVQKLPLVRSPSKPAA